MKFVPFQPPVSDYAGLATGIGTDGGVNAKTFVEGVNKAFTHVFAVMEGGVQHEVGVIDADARKVVASLEDEIKRTTQILVAFTQAYGEQKDQIASLTSIVNGIIAAMKQPGPNVPTVAAEAQPEDQITDTQASSSSFADILASVTGAKHAS